MKKSLDVERERKLVIAWELYLFQTQTLHSKGNSSEVSVDVHKEPRCPAKVRKIKEKRKKRSKS